MKSILLLDTDKSMLLRYEKWFEQNEYTPLIAHTAKDALSLLKRYPQIQIMITQQFLEDMDLEIFISSILSTIPDMYIIVTTTMKPSREVQNSIVNLGVDAILYKPFSFEQLHLILNNIETSAPKHPKASIKWCLK
jgi:DNA-binding NtrC family response regulator